MEKHETDRKKPPVVTDFDGRPEKREHKSDPFEGDAQAPDGISGDWD